MLIPGTGCVQIPMVSLMIKNSSYKSNRFLTKKDLELRGPGELLGSRQTGLMEFKVADLQRDKGLLDQVQATAQRLYHHHPEAISPLLQRWLPNIEHYLNV